MPGVGFPGSSTVKNSITNAGDARNRGFSPWVRKINWRRKWQPAPVLLPGEFHGQRDLKPHTQLSTHASKLWKPNPSLKTVAGEASELLLLLLTVYLGLDRHIRTAGFGDSKDTIDPQCLSASQLSSSPCVTASYSGFTRRQDNYSGPSLPGLAGKEELLVAAW